MKFRDGPAAVSCLPINGNTSPFQRIKDLWERIVMIPPTTLLNHAAITELLDGTKMPSVISEKACMAMCDDKSEDLPHFADAQPPGLGRVSLTELESHLSG